MINLTTSQRSLAPYDRASLIDAFLIMRRQTEKLCEPLETEDYVIQSVSDVSPPKWHLAHTSWFFENFVLDPNLQAYQRFHPMYAYLFNSYYNLAGKYHPRVKRGVLSRPTVSDIYNYRSHVTESVVALLQRANDEQVQSLGEIMTLGINHEQQHQELLVTDIKHILWCNPLEAVYRERAPDSSSPVARLGWREFDGGLHEFGFDGDGFSFDNELPRHPVFLNDFRIADRLVTNGEYLAFVQDGGYQRPELWLSDGWYTLNEQGWEAPLYWENRDGDWWSFTLAGMRPIDLNEPVVHVSHYEADAYARWAGARLPNEFEWERAAAGLPLAGGNFVESERYHPRAATPGNTASMQFFGDVWEWTSSAYLPYPGFTAAPGAVGEYNGKFMSSQMVLRGGSCATPENHIRPTYRNFFQPYLRWQFMGLRLAADA
ncbi:MAG TPA: ergothioneine biosynthesis protein EgtB [Dehalococcoidia bacterium]|nr:ergothioneine biosynthesis protein EgtB [Dehalococcoidia bacterium]